MAQLTALPEIIGLPPSTPETESIIKSTFPVMEVIPCKTDGFSENLFTISPDMTSYKSLLNGHEYSMSGNSVKLAFVADNFPTDTFSNFYAESFLGTGLQVVSEEASQVAQMLGAKTWTQAGNKVLDMMRGVSQATGVKGIGEVANWVGKVSTGAANAFNTATKNAGTAGAFIRRAATLANSTLAGRIDLPQIWKNSNFTPAYTITVKLFNPNPGNINATKKYITGPLCAILLLALPKTTDGVFYSWPFFHKIKVPGLLTVQQAYIGNVTVIKGGDQQVISYKQNLGMCDVRIEFGCLFDTMVATGGTALGGRPTLKEYISELEGGRNVPEPIRTLGTNEEPELIRLRTITSSSSRKTTEQPVSVSGEAPTRVEPERTAVFKAEIKKWEADHPEYMKHVDPKTGKFKPLQNFP